MGYTHYWTPKPISAKAWVAVNDDFAKLFRTAKQNGIILSDANGEAGKPVNGADYIAFNGRGENAHESAWFDREATDFNFCKTAHKPYDSVVVAALLYLSGRHGYEVTTDGSAAEWKAGLDLARKAWPHECITAYVNDDGLVRVTMHATAE